MTPALALCLLVLLGLVAMGTPIAHSILVGAIVYLAASSQDLALAAEQILAGLHGSFVLLSVPLFIVAAGIMNAGTLSERLLRFCVATVGRFRGGLGHVNVAASMVFSGMSGSAVADAAGIGKIIIDMMTRSGHYSPGYAAAITAASATVGPIIPPSIPMLLYGLVSNMSIGYLFLAGVLPGLLIGIFLMLANAAMARRRGFGVEPKVALTELPRHAREALPALLMPVIMLYAIYGGVTTPTEAAAVAAVYALLLAALYYRALSLSQLYEILVTSAKSSATVGLAIGGAFALNYVAVSENIPNLMPRALVGLDVPPLVFLLGVNVLILLLGFIFDATTLIIVVLPLFLPTCRELGIDLLHFGTVAVVNCMIGLITPPYGMLLFVINAVTKTPLSEIVREVWFFLGVLVLSLVVLILCPGFCLWLPRLFGYPG